MAQPATIRPEPPTIHPPFAMMLNRIRTLARVPMVTGRYEYCEGSGFGFNPTGHMVPKERIKAGYRGHLVCGDCMAEHYPEPERVRLGQAKTG